MEVECVQPYDLVTVLTPPASSRSITNRDLLLPYGLPYFAYVGIAALGRDRIPVEAEYLLKLLVVPLLLYWAWKWYVPVTGPKKARESVVWGVGAGLAGLVLWCLLMAPFIEHEGDPWPLTGFVLRLVSAGLIVPVFEEMFIRGYILRAAYQWDINRKNPDIKDPFIWMLDRDRIDDVAPGAWTASAVGISTLAFTVGHAMVEWPAAVSYGLLMSLLWVVRKDLLSCMVAHGITNLGLALYVLESGRWGFW